MNVRPELSREPLSQAPYFAVELDPGRGEVVMLDQRRLPAEIVYLRYATADEVVAAIRDMVVRGAPAIGIAAAYALVLQARRDQSDAAGFLVANGIAGRVLGAARPTAVNLGWAIARMARRAAQVARLAPRQRAQALQQEAEAIHAEDVQACQRMGRAGAAQLPDEATVLTHCNAGALATGGYGTALGVIRAAAAMGKRVRVLAGETRPYLQGARLTAWELQQDGIEVQVITDSMAGYFMKRGVVSSCVVGSDRIAANGDVANKIGTYGLAVLAHAHGVPFNVAAPWSTVDLATADGERIPIEQRPRNEVAELAGVTLVAPGIECPHPAFDVTPARLVAAIYTERGTFFPARGETPASLLSEDAGATDA